MFSKLPYGLTVENTKSFKEAVTTQKIKFEE